MKKPKTIMRVSSTSNKPNFPDGFQLMETLHEYCRCLGWVGQRHPSTVAIRFPLFLRLPHWQTSLQTVATWISASFRSRPFPSIPVVDVVLFYSSKKPSVWPSFDLLAQRLATENLRCLVLSPEGMEIVQYEKKKLHREKIDDANVWSGHQQTRGQSIAVMISSLFDLMLIFWKLLASNRALFALCFRDPLQVWSELLLAHYQFGVAREIVRRSSPKIVITNGDHIPMGAALTIAANALNIHTVWWFNEHPTVGMVPFFSKEVWVWNATVVKTFESLIPKKDRLLFTIVGKAEIDTALLIPEKKSLRDRDIQIPADVPVCLFLSEYDANPALNIGPITEASLLWIAQAAKSLPDWYFIICTRPVHDRIILPGYESLKGMSSILWSTSISTHSLLRTDQVQAVTGCGTQALYVSAGLGKKAIRLLPSSTSMSFPVIDEVTSPANSAEELILLLQQSSVHQKMINDSNHFPYKGSVLKTVGKIVQRRLAEY